MAAGDIANHFVKSFEKSAIHLVQQKYSKLRRTVTEKSPGPTEKHAFRVAAARGAMTARTNVGLVAGKRTNTPYADTVLNDRVVGTTRYGTADSFSRAEMVRMIEDPQSLLYTSMVPQVARTFDDVIVAALFAAALDSAGNSTNHPAGSQLGGAATAPSFSLVRDVRKAVLKKDIDPDEECFFVVSPDFVTTLLDDPKATSFDYANAKALMAGGIIPGWMGFTWITSNRLTKPVAGPPAQVYCAAYTKDAVGLLVQDDLHVEIGKDPGQWFDETVMLECDIGAVRIQDEKCFRVHILETA